MTNLHLMKTSPANNVLSALTDSALNYSKSFLTDTNRPIKRDPDVNALDQQLASKKIIRPVSSLLNIFKGKFFSVYLQAIEVLYTLYR